MVEVAPPRRRSVDVGGLALALSDGAHGHGWGGWDEEESGGTRYAEAIIDVRVHTEDIVNTESVEIVPPFILDDGVRTRLIESLGEWGFEPHKLPEEEVLACAYILFEALFRIEGLQDAVGVCLEQITGFLHQLQQIYRRNNTYHNFEHALDVYQATYYFLNVAEVVPPVSILLQPDARWRRQRGMKKNEFKGHTAEQEVEEEERLIDCLTHEDLFALCIAAVGHDVGHPGLTNAFMKNAQTPLAVLYDDKSVLEQMHYSLIMRIMKNNGLEHLLFPRARDRDKDKEKDENLKSTNNAPQNRPDSRSEAPADYATQQKEKLHQDHPRHQRGSNMFRKLLLMTVLATDLSVHGEFMRRFDRMLVERNGPSGESAAAEGPGPGGGKTGPEDELFERKMLLCQALIKCADISNPCRPYSVSQHWAAALESEWSSQLLLEKHLHLPTTVKPSDNSLAEANTQVFFIGTFAKPLFELTARGIPQMEPFAAQCRENLHLWAERKGILTAAQDLLAISPTSNTQANPALVELQASSSSVSPSCLHSIPARTPEDFLSAFPPTLPKSFLSPEVSEAGDVQFVGGPGDVMADLNNYEIEPCPQCLSNSLSRSRSRSRSRSKSRSRSNSMASIESGSEGLSVYETCTSSSPSPPSSPVNRVAFPRGPIGENGNPISSAEADAGEERQIDSEEIDAHEVERNGNPLKSPAYSNSSGHSHSHHNSTSTHHYPHRHNHHHHHHHRHDSRSHHTSSNPQSHPHTHRAPSITSTLTTSSMVSNASAVTATTAAATAAIRAAYKASVRKKPSRKFLHRSSWNPTPTEFGDMIHGSASGSGNRNLNGGVVVNGGLLSPGGQIPVPSLLKIESPTGPLSEGANTPEGEGEDVVVVVERPPSPSVSVMSRESSSATATPASPQGTGTREISV